MRVLLGYILKFYIIRCIITMESFIQLKSAWFRAGGTRALFDGKGTTER